MSPPSLAGYFLSVPLRVIANVMALGSGVLVSTLAFDLMDEAYRPGGFASTSAGSLCGALLYTAITVWLSWRGTLAAAFKSAEVHDDPPDIIIGSVAKSVSPEKPHQPSSAPRCCPFMCSTPALAPLWRQY